MTDEERSALIQQAMDICAKLRDDELPPSWKNEFGAGFRCGCDHCLSMIFNELQPINK